MIDLHSHFLPGVDDGAGDIDVARTMIRQAASVGITRLLATPHINEHTTPDAIRQIRERFGDIRKEIENEGLRLRIDLAAEIRFDPALFDWLSQGWLMIGREKRYMIIELPIQGLPINLSDHLFTIRTKGIIPIIAHPERNIVFQNQWQKLFEQLARDCIIQVNAGSILGQFGPGARQLAFVLLRRQKAHLVCSDAHEARKRNYMVLQRAYSEVQREFGAAAADVLFFDNPHRILEGGELTAMPSAPDKKGLKSLIKKYLKVGN